MKPTVTRNVHAYVHWPSGWHGPFAAIITKVGDTTINMMVFPAEGSVLVGGLHWAEIAPIDPKTPPTKPGESQWYWAWPPREPVASPEPIAKVAIDLNEGDFAPLRLFIGGKPIIKEGDASVWGRWDSASMQEIARLINNSK